MLKRILIIVALAIIIYFYNYTTTGEHYNHAIELEQQGKIEEAIAELDKAIKKTSDFRPALLNRGAYKSEIGDTMGALEDYQKLLEVDPDNTFALFNMANSYSDLDKPKKAIEYYTKALETDGALKASSINDGQALYIRTNFDLKRFDSDMDYDMPDYEIYFERGIEYLKDKQYDNAISDFNSCLELRHNERDSNYYLGEAFIGMKDSLKACIHYTKSEKLGDQDSKDKLKVYCLEKEY
ncbi:MAG: tetratricopeptide repeat protein [Bacteroidota bacterium]